MTFLQAVLPYEPPVGERELGSLAGMRAVYGIRAVSFDERSHSVLVEYDASRLTPGDLIFMAQKCRRPCSESAQQSRVII